MNYFSIISMFYAIIMQLIFIMCLCDMKQKNYHWLILQSFFVKLFKKCDGWLSIEMYLVAKYNVCLSIESQFRVAVTAGRITYH